MMLLVGIYGIRRGVVVVVVVVVVMLWAELEGGSEE